MILAICSKNSVFLRILTVSKIWHLVNNSTYAMVAGVPAKIIGWISAYGNVLEFDADGYAVDTVGMKYQQISDTEVRKLS